MPAIFYPPSYVQSSVPPQIKFPIPIPPPAPDNPPLLIDVYKYLIVQTWLPVPLWAGNLKVHSGLPIMSDTTGDVPPIHRENTIDRINLSWYIPNIPINLYNGQGPIAHLIPLVDSPLPKLQAYPVTIYDQHVEIYNWKVVKHRPIKDIFITPGIVPIPVPASFQVNVNIYSVRHSLDIEINNNKDIQNVNQGSTFLFTIHAFNRKGFPRKVNTADAVSLSLKDSLGNIVFSSGVTTKTGDVFTYIHQLDTNAPLGPWSVQAVGSFKNTDNNQSDIRITPYAICFTVI